MPGILHPTRNLFLCWRDERTLVPPGQPVISHDVVEEILVRSLPAQEARSHPNTELRPLDNANTGWGCL